MDEMDDIPNANCDVRAMARLVIGEGTVEGAQVNLRFAKGDLVVIWRGGLCTVARRAAWRRALLEEIAGDQDGEDQPDALLTCA